VGGRWEEFAPLRSLLRADRGCQKEKLHVSSPFWEHSTRKGIGVDGAYCMLVRGSRYQTTLTSGGTGGPTVSFVETIKGKLHKPENFSQ